MSDTKYCASHPNTPTNLTCGRCGKPICPQCMVDTPVGYRCKECGQGPRLPTYDVPVSSLARAVGAALLLGIGGGVALAVVQTFIFDGLLYIAAFGGYGYVLGEAISKATNHKRGRALQLTAVGGVLLALLVITIITPPNLFDLVGAGAAIYIAYLRLR